ncbi:MAG: hypothetical protein ABR552_02245 [Actinomycetota bacterium]
MRELPVLQCSLDATDMAARADAWRAVLRSGSVGSERATRSASFSVPRVHEPALRELIRLEGRCCPFFTFTTMTAGGDVVVEVTVPEGGESTLDKLVSLLG